MSRKDKDRNRPNLSKIDGFNKRGQKKPDTISHTMDFPKWMIEAIDQEADLLQIPRNAVIKTWLADRIKEGMALQLGEDL